MVPRPGLELGACRLTALYILMLEEAWRVVLESAKAVVHVTSSSMSAIDDYFFGLDF